MRDAASVNKFRREMRGTHWETTEADGMYGCFMVPIDERHSAECIVSSGTDPSCKETGLDWEHVSLKIRYRRTDGRYKMRLPTWEEMQFIKEVFWKDDEAVIQIHPPKSDYVNTHPYVLHLWRPTDGQLRLPPKICV